MSQDNETKAVAASSTATQGSASAASGSAAGSSASEVFARQLGRALEELYVTGFDAIDSGFLVEMENIAKISREIGFDKVSELITDLITTCENYSRYGSNRNAQGVMQALAHLYFAQSFLNFGKSDAKAMSSELEEALVDGEEAGEKKETGDLSDEFLAALDNDNDYL